MTGNNKAESNEINEILTDIRKMAVVREDEETIAIETEIQTINISDEDRKKLLSIIEKAKQLKATGKIIFVSALHGPTSVTVYESKTWDGEEDVTHYI